MLIMNRRLYAWFKCNTTDGAKTLRVQRLLATTGVKKHNNLWRVMIHEFWQIFWTNLRNIFHFIWFTIMFINSDLFLRLVVNDLCKLDYVKDRQKYKKTVGVKFSGDFFHQHKLCYQHNHGGFPVFSKILYNCSLIF